MTKEKAIEVLQDCVVPTHPDDLDALQIAIECIQHCIDEEDSPCYNCYDKHCENCIYSGRI